MKLCGLGLRAEAPALAVSVELTESLHQRCSFDLVGAVPPPMRRMMLLR